ncbi:MAG TPA: sigma-70 family RNA polymerase sigma factor [Conexibacter sp.]|jgi:RNA polymerase sigma factor (sigma-70 family)|nr:sigma-70 family RNA polymerase sigma factor [Conexibacter sp.]
MRSRKRRENSAEDATLQLVQEHAAELLRFARRFSHCPDDAHDAYQRAVEILVRRMRVDPPAQPLSWMRTVLRHEALAVRGEREQLVGRFAIDLDRQEDRAVADPAEHVVGHERLRHTAEALRRLKPQEVTALVLRAEGLSYREICTRTGWSYTRANRTITEGRRALLERLGAIESGAECERWLPLLSALADGEATAQELAELRPHLRSCPGCRATLRDAHAVPEQVAMLVPPAIVDAAMHGPNGSLPGHVEVALHAVVERATMLTARVHGAFEALPGAKLAAVAASTAAIAGGGVALEQATTHDRPAAHRSVDTTAASAAPLTGIGRLTAIGFPRLPATATAHHTRRTTARRSEFTAEPSAPSEFTPSAAPRAEFAAARAAPAAVASAPAATPEPSAPRPSPSEFVGP